MATARIVDMTAVKKGDFPEAGTPGFHPAVGGRTGPGPEAAAKGPDALPSEHSRAEVIQNLAGDLS